MNKFSKLLNPSKDIPTTVWSSDNPKTILPNLDTLIILISGLWIFGTGQVFIINAQLGVGPWIVLAQGISIQLDWTIGFATFIISLVVLIFWVPLKETPGIGTLLNVVLIAISIDIMMPLLPEPSSLGIAVIQSVFGVFVVGAGSCLYLTANLGPGPRDGWMTSIHRRTGLTIGKVRTGIEVIVMIIGYILGGSVGIGTLLFAFGIGPSLVYCCSFLEFWNNSLQENEN